MESCTLSNEREEMETKAPNSQGAFSSRHKLDLVQRLLKNSAFGKDTRGNGKQLTLATLLLILLKEEPW